ncbi:MAG TPA: hypothetical protein VIL46_08760 [Gemmataceae bacterium]
MRPWIWIGGIALLGGAALVYLLRPGGVVYVPPRPPSFDGPSTQLRETVVVPTLDTPLPEGKSAVWCASSQLGWNTLRRDVVGEPVRLSGAQEIADRLNRFEFPGDALSAEAYYAAAGLVRDGIAEKIRGDMAERFPDVPAPKFGEGNVAVAYAYLRASVRFRLPYYEDRLVFTDPGGRQTGVWAFGIREEDAYAAERLREQVEVLFISEEFDHRDAPLECALDLCKDSSPYQVVVARVGKQETLAATVAAVQERARKRSDGEYLSRFRPADELLVPVMVWKIEHHFEELEGKSFENESLKGLPLDTVLQVISFRLDKSGGDLAAEWRSEVKAGPRRFHFDRPYLVYMKKRGAEQPFLAMWVENAELMTR